ncbi:MAG: aminoacyl-tRNA hydrolase [Campylobacterota bacterium]|nr:aminoacyl-tRNA hydrolase [Campylobacterota bacterium]
MYLIAGLGNPGEKYSQTRHNIGFMVIDEMTKSLNTTNINRSNFKATVEKSLNTLYVKPQTYMNLSGESLGSIANYYNIPIENIIVIHDDLDLPFGTIKFKVGGGHGGHNGLRSIDSHLGKDYIRVRLGIGKPQNKQDVANFVLSRFSQEEFDKINDIILHTIKSIEALKSEDLIEVKSKYTKKL